MGQRESRTLRNGNQVAAEALDAFQRDYSLAATRLESCGGLKSNNPTSPRILDAERAPERAQADSSMPAGSSENSPPEEQEQMSSNSSRPVRRIVKVRRGEASGRACSCCSPAPCLRCHHEMLKRRSQLELVHLNQCRSTYCTSSSSLKSIGRSSPPKELTVRPLNGRLVEPPIEPAGFVSGELSASTIQQPSKFYDSGGGRERGARKHARRCSNQLVKSEQARHLAASLGGGAGNDLARGHADRKSAARPHPTRRSAATGEAQHSSVSSASSMASTLTLVSGASSLPASDCLFTLAPLESPLRTAEIAANCHAASDEDSPSVNSHAATTSTSQTTTNTNTSTKFNATRLPSDQLVRKTVKNVANCQRPTCAEISKLSETEAPAQVFADDTKLHTEGIKSATSGNREPLDERKYQLLLSANKKEIEQQAADGSEPPAPLEADQVSAMGARVTRLAWSELAHKYGCKMSLETSKQPIVSKTPNDRSDEQSYGGISLPPRRPPDPSRSSCLCHLLCALLQTLFPIIGSLKNYSLPGDLASDLAAGFTVAVLHIPQGMAYGLLSGVDPIYGLYVSFIPVLVMSLMSKSRHVSYGTFAVISMLLVNTIDNVRTSLDRELGPANVSEPNSLPLVLTDNHQPAPALKRLGLPAQSRDEITMSAGASVLSSNLLIDSSVTSENLALVSEATNRLLLQPPSGIEILACVCFVCGLIHITMSLMRLGVLSLIFSDQLVSSFTTASAIHVFTSQLAGLLDLSLPPVHEDLFKIFRVWWNFGYALLFEGFNRTTGLLSLCSIAFLLLIKQLVEPALRRRSKLPICLPSELLLMVIVILCSWKFKFGSEYNVKIIGFVPTGFPEAVTPRLELVPYVLKDSITIALISYVMNLSIATVYAKRYRYELDPNQELFALGTANIVSSFFSCFPCASSLSRSSVQSTLNVRSQLCSLFSCALVVLIICFFATILHDLPRSTLSCIILVALKGILMQVNDLLDNWRLSKLDALVWIITFVSVIVTGVTYGLIIGIFSSLFMVFIRLLTPNHSILGRLPDTEIYVDVNAFVECQEFERVKIFRFNSALCYLNRTQLKSKIEKLFPDIYKAQGFSAICAQFHQRGPIDQAASSNINFLIIDCSALSYCDYSGAATLVELIEDLESEKVTVYLAACPLKLIDMLAKMKSTGKILSQNVYATISDAMSQVRHLLSSIERSSEKKASSFGSRARQTTPASQSCDKSQQTIIHLR